MTDGGREQDSEVTDRKADKIVEIDHYTGGEACHYDCGELAEFVVVAEKGTRRITFAGCEDCLNTSAIWPYKNGWVDERTDYVENA